MVTVTYFFLVISLYVQGTFSRAQDPLPPEVVVPDYNYNAYDYVGTNYNDYYYPTVDYVKPVAYGDYAKQYGQYGDYYQQYGDYAYNDYDYYKYYEDYGFYDDDYIHEYGDYYGFGDRNNPLDTALGVYDETGVSAQLPWVYIIVPVLQVDLYYVDDEQKGIENIDFELPIETFLFELGDFGLGHFELGDFGLGELEWDDHFFGNFGTFGNYDYPAYDYAYEDYPIYGHYPAGSKPQLYDNAEALEDPATMDYPAYDYQPLWVDWIFMVPPDDAGPVVR